MFVRYPYRRDNYYRSRVAPMEIDRDESPIWAMPVAKKKLVRNDDEEMRNRHTTSRKGLFKLKKGKNKEEKEEEDNSSQTKLVKFDPQKNKYEEETEEQITEYVDNNVESESDYEEDSIETENQMSFEYQHPGKLMKPMPYNNPYYAENMNKKTSVLKDSSFPQLLSSYSKFLFNTLLLVVALWIIFSFIITVRTDMKIKYNEYVMDKMTKISKCYEDYKINKCSSDERIPFLENTCKEWEACMNQSPDEVRMIMIGAEVISEILNKFIEPLSTKTTVVIIIVSIVFFFIIWKMGSDPSKVKKDKIKQKQYNQDQHDQMNQEGMPLGMCPPPSMDPGFINNGGVMYPIAPAAIYPGNPSYPIPVTYPQVYPYPVCPPAYQDDRDMYYYSNPKYRKAPRHSPSPPPSGKKNYRFVKSSRNRNPYKSRFRVNEPRYPPHRRSRERYYYEDDRDDRYDMVEDDDSYFDEDYGY